MNGGDTQANQAGAVRIVPGAIPDGEWALLCRVLSGCVKQAMADPAKREEYEAWKSRYRAARS